MMGIQCYIDLTFQLPMLPPVISRWNGSKVWSQSTYPGRYCIIHHFALLCVWSVNDIHGIDYPLALCGLVDGLSIVPSHLGDVE